MAAFDLPVEGPDYDVYAYIRPADGPVVWKALGANCFGLLLGSLIRGDEIVYAIRHNSKEMAEQYEKLGTTQAEFVDWWLNIVKNEWGVDGIEKLDPTEELAAPFKDRYGVADILCLLVIQRDTRMPALVRTTLSRYLEEFVQIAQGMYALCQAAPDRFTGSPEKLYEAFMTAHNLMGPNGSSIGSHLGSGHSLLLFRYYIPYATFVRTLNPTGNEMQAGQYNSRSIINQMYTFEQIINEGKDYFNHDASK